MLISIACHQLHAQHESRFRNFHGIIQNDAQYFEAEGYAIFIHKEKFGVDEKGLKKIKKKYKIDNEQSTTDSILRSPANVLACKMQKDGLTSYLTYYLLSGSGVETTVIGFARSIERDTVLEQEFVNAYLSRNIPSFVYTQLVIDSIDFVGRTIILGSACHWMSPHNIQCSDVGQMNWAIFDNQKNAENFRDAQYNLTKSKNLTSILKEEWITVIFEGEEVRALRSKVKIQIPKFVMGGSNVLIVYYVTAEVRGKFVTCIMSHYTDDADENQLPYLLSEVMELK